MISAASSSRCSAARRRRGRSRRGRSSASGCGASACFMASAADDAEGQARIAAFLQGLQELGWTVGRNVRIDYRWGAGDPMPTACAKYAAELVALAPDVILATTAPIVAAVAAGDAAPCRSCSRLSSIRSAPASSTAWRGRAATPPVSCMFEYGMSAKWLELLKEIAPGVTRAAVLRDPARDAGIGQFAAIQAAAPSFGVELSPIDVRDAGEIERAIAASRAEPNGGLIVTASTVCACVIAI